MWDCSMNTCCKTLEIYYKYIIGILKSLELECANCPLWEKYGLCIEEI